MSKVKIGYLPLYIKLYDDSNPQEREPMERYMHTLVNMLEAQGLEFLSAEVRKIPQNTVSVTDPEQIKQVRNLLDMLEENDDVQSVFHNAELPDEED